MDAAAISADLVAKTMQAAVAPVFLISAVAVLLSCMATRYGRVIDRIRTLLRDGKMLYGKFTNKDHLEKEIGSLYRRAKILRNSMILATCSILLIVIAVMLLFLHLRYEFSFYTAPEIFFAIALFALVGSVVMFIEDFAISLDSIKNDINTRGYADAIDPHSEPPAKPEAEGATP